MIKEGDKGSQVRLIKRNFNSTVFKVTTNTPGILLMTDLYYPGWEARLKNSIKLPIIEVDYALRGIPIPKGIYEVEVYYSPMCLKLGLLLSLFTFISIVIIYVRNKNQA